MKIVHLSDWHGNQCYDSRDGKKLPWAELYIVTGDMLPNFYWFRYDVTSTKPLQPMKVEEWPSNMHLFGEDPGPRPRGVYVGRRTDPIREAELQTRYIELDVQKGGFRRHLGNPDAHVAIVRGNHDFVDLAPWFVGGPTFEFSNSAMSFMLGDYEIAGIRGINYIYGEFSDEYTDTQWRDALRLLPRDCDILLSHAPPRNIRDFAGEHYGSDQLSSYVTQRMMLADRRGTPPLRAHFFGHVHEQAGSETREGVLFSNAATTWIEYEI